MSTDKPGEMLPEYEAHIDLVQGKIRYALSFKSNADRSAFLKAALIQPAPVDDGATGCVDADLRYNSKGEPTGYGSMPGDPNGDDPDGVLTAQKVIDVIRTTPGYTTAVAYLSAFAQQEARTQAIYGEVVDINDIKIGDKIMYRDGVTGEVFDIKERVIDGYNKKVEEEYLCRARFFVRVHGGDRYYTHRVDGVSCTDAASDIVALLTQSGGDAK